MSKAFGLPPGTRHMFAGNADREGGEATLRLALRGRPQMLGRATAALVHSSHGRFFFRKSAVAAFLQAESPAASRP